MRECVDVLYYSLLQYFVILCLLWKDADAPYIVFLSSSFSVHPQFGIRCFLILLRNSKESVARAICKPHFFLCYNEF
jgi:hypothetical protein